MYHHQCSYSHETCTAPAALSLTYCSIFGWCISSQAFLNQGLHFHLSPVSTNSCHWFQELYSTNGDNINDIEARAEGCTIIYIYIHIYIYIYTYSMYIIILTIILLLSWLCIFGIYDISHYLCIYKSHEIRSDPTSAELICPQLIIWPRAYEPATSTRSLHRGMHRVCMGYESDTYHTHRGICWQDRSCLACCFRWDRSHLKMVCLFHGVA